MQIPAGPEVVGDRRSVSLGVRMTPRLLLTLVPVENSYVLKLFRDYVFHSVDEMGNPVLDMTHVLLALNKVSD